MVIATVIPNEFDQTMLDTLENCIMKISAHLRKKFDPNETESKSLFRLFCSSINTRSRMINKIVSASVQAHKQIKNDQKAVTTTQNDLSNLKNIPSGNANASCIADETVKRQKRGSLGAFWRNKKLA